MYETDDDVACGGTGRGHTGKWHADSPGSLDTVPQRGAGLLPTNPADNSLIPTNVWRNLSGGMRRGKRRTNSYPATNCSKPLLFMDRVGFADVVIDAMWAQALAEAKDRYDARMAAADPTDISLVEAGSDGAPLFLSRSPRWAASSSCALPASPLRLCEALLKPF